MKLRLLTLSALMAVAAAAQAHTHLEASVPADKSRVQAPGAIELHFSEAARLTSLTLQKGKEAAQPLKPLPSKAAAKLSVPVEALSAGEYVVNWRVAGDDGHVMTGKFAFTVDPAAKPAMHDGMKMGDHAHMDHMKSETPQAGSQDEHKH